LTLRTLLAQLGKTLLVMAACHAVLVGVSLWLFPPTRDVDALDRSALYRGAFERAVFGALESGFGDGRQLVVVGSSNALLGFRPSEIEALLPDVRVHNLSTASMRMDEIRQMVQLVWDVMPAAQRKRTTFVVTLIFASFPPPKSLYVRREAGVAHEIRRSGAFVELDGDLVPRWTGPPLTAALLLRRPLALAEVVADELSSLGWGVQEFLSAAFRKRVFDPSLLAQRRPDDVLLFPRADTPHGKLASLAFFRAALAGEGDGLGRAQFDELARLRRWAEANGVDLVLVGMPVPGWVRDGLPYFAEYERELRRVLDDPGDGPGARFVDLASADLPMWDATHPEPGGTSAWAARLIEALRDARAQDSPQ